MQDSTQSSPSFERVHQTRTTRSDEVPCRIIDNGTWEVRELAFLSHEYALLPDTHLPTCSVCPRLDLVDADGRTLVPPSGQLLPLPGVRSAGHECKGAQQQERCSRCCKVSFWFDRRCAEAAKGNVSWHFEWLLEEETSFEFWLLEAHVSAVHVFIFARRCGFVWRECL